MLCSLYLTSELSHNNECSLYNIFNYLWIKILWTWELKFKTSVELINQSLDWNYTELNKIWDNSITNGKYWLLLNHLYKSKIMKIFKKLWRKYLNRKFYKNIWHIIFRQIQLRFSSNELILKMNTILANVIENKNK